SPSSGYSRPTMCLMQTDLPVPEGPRIIEILPSGMPMFRPRRILLRPKALWTSTNSTASGAPVGRLSPVCQRNSSSSERWGSLTTDTRSVCLRMGPALLLVARQILLAQRLLGVLVGGPSLVFHEFSLRSVLSGWHP